MSPGLAHQGASVWGRYPLITLIQSCQLVVRPASWTCWREQLRLGPGPAALVSTPSFWTLTLGVDFNRCFCVQPGSLCPLSWTAVALWLWRGGVQRRWRRSWEKWPQSSVCLLKREEELRVSRFSACGVPQGASLEPPIFSVSNFIVSVKDTCLTSASGLLKADSAQLQLLSLGSSSSEQASTSKQQFPVDQLSYGASGSRESIFSLAGPGYMTARQNCSGRALGCVSDLDYISFFASLPGLTHGLLLSQVGLVGLWIW